MFPVTGKIITQGYFKTFSTGCLLNKIANILFWLLQFIYYTQVATESIFVTKHQTKIWESVEEEEERWVRENTLCALLQVPQSSFPRPAFPWEQSGSSWSKVSFVLPASHLDHPRHCLIPDLQHWRFFGGLKKRQRCGKPNANVEITGKMKNFCMFYTLASCPKFIMVNAHYRKATSQK